MRLKHNSSNDRLLAEFNNRSKGRLLTHVNRGISSELQPVNMHHRSATKLGKSALFKEDQIKLKIKTTKGKKLSMIMKKDLTFEEASVIFDKITVKFEGRLLNLKANLKESINGLKLKALKSNLLKRTLGNFNRIVDEMESRLNRVTRVEVVSNLEFLRNEGIPVKHKLMCTKERKLVAEVKGTMENLQFCNQLEEIILNNVLLLSREFVAAIEIYVSKHGVLAGKLKLDPILLGKWTKVQEIAKKADNLKDNKREIIGNTIKSCNGIVKDDDTLKKLQQVLLKSLLEKGDSVKRKKEFSLRKKGEKTDERN